MKTILNFLKTVLKIGAQAAPAVVSAYSPALGNLVQKILDAVITAEGAVPLQGQGAVKSTFVSLLLTAGGDGIAAAFSAAGKPIANPVLFAAGVAEIQEGVVKILNATGDGAKVSA